MQTEEVNGVAWRWYGGRVLGGESVLFQSTMTVEQMRSCKLEDFIRYRCMTSVTAKPSASGGVNVSFGRSIIDAEEENDGIIRKDTFIRISLPNSGLIAQVCDYWGKKSILAVKESDLKIIQ